VTPERLAVLVRILGEGGTVYRSQLSAQQRAHLPVLLGSGHVTDDGRRVKLTAAGRAMAQQEGESG